MSTQQERSDALVIRPATTDDLPAVLRLFRGDELHSRAEAQGPIEDYLDAFRAIEADPNNQVMVAELNGDVVGTFQITFIQQLTYGGCKIAQVESVQVAAPMRGRGIGERMMRWAIEEARSRGCLRVQLTSNKKRVDAHRFYERLGFTKSHEGMKLYLE